ncbi:MAG: LON peptidase substrate-binding domain-containing protein, partial [Candidatus Competibacterales bacterium]|nr:LON peptidase substrate-binding domain-containing protein [Candidatus Competibacterales bacterium]
MSESEHDAIDAEVLTDDEEENQDSTELAVADELLPDTLYLLPLSERPFFPAQALPLLLNAEPWLPTLEKAVKGDQQKVIGLILVKPETPDQITDTDDFHDTGTVVRIHQLTRQGDKLQFIAQGLRR